VSDSIRPRTSWRSSAAKVVEELFPVSPQSTWDELLELRSKLVDGGSCEEVLEWFAVCRRALEIDHYLPFYRLRRLLAAHLELEGASDVTLESLLRRPDFSFRRWRDVRKGHRLVESA
jgi:hypothetical protein